MCATVSIACDAGKERSLKKNALKVIKGERLNTNGLK